MRKYLVIFCVGESVSKNEHLTHIKFIIISLRRIAMFYAFIRYKATFFLTTSGKFIQINVFLSKLAIQSLS